MRLLVSAFWMSLFTLLGNFMFYLNWLKVEFTHCKWTDDRSDQKLWCGEALFLSVVYSQFHPRRFRSSSRTLSSVCISHGGNLSSETCSVLELINKNKKQYVDVGVRARVWAQVSP